MLLGCSFLCVLCVDTDVSVCVCVYYLFCRGIDHHWTKNMFATCSSKVQVWDHQRSEPTHEFSWGADSITSVKFNPAEASLLASTGSDRTVTLYDIRVASSMRKIVMEMRSNALAWNPMEPFNFTVVRIFSYQCCRLLAADIVCHSHSFVVYIPGYRRTRTTTCTRSTCAG